MSPRAWQARLSDILRCIVNIQSFTSGMIYDDFVNNAITIRAVAFELITMGEAARAVPKTIQEQYSDIPWGKMQDIRNVIVHEYYRMDEEIIWETIRDDLPSLKGQIEQIISNNA